VGPKGERVEKSVRGRRGGEGRIRFKGGEEERREKAGFFVERPPLQILGRMRLVLAEEKERARKIGSGVTSRGGRDGGVGSGPAGAEGSTTSEKPRRACCSPPSAPVVSGRGGPLDG
jgi:hypothetical protein